MIYGIDSYSNVRVSTKDQNEARQMIAMIIMLVGSRFFLPAVLCPLCPIPFVHRDKLRTELKPLTAEKRNLDVVWKNVHAIISSEHSIQVERQTKSQHRRAPSL